MNASELCGEVRFQFDSKNGRIYLCSRGEKRVGLVKTGGVMEIAEIVPKRLDVKIGFKTPYITEEISKEIKSLLKSEGLSCACLPGAYTLICSCEGVTLETDEMGRLTESLYSKLKDTLETLGFSVKRKE